MTFDGLLQVSINYKFTLKCLKTFSEFYNNVLDSDIMVCTRVVYHFMLHSIFIVNTKTGSIKLQICTSYVIYFYYFSNLCILTINVFKIIR